MPVRNYILFYIFFRIFLIYFFIEPELIHFFNNFIIYSSSTRSHVCLLTLQ